LPQQCKVRVPSAQVAKSAGNRTARPIEHVGGKPQPCCILWLKPAAKTHTLHSMNSNGRRAFLKQAATLAGAFSANSLFHQAHGSIQQDQ
jgi:hypothetical protein